MVSTHDETKDKIPFFKNQTSTMKREEEEKNNISAFEFDTSKNPDELSLDFILSSRIKFRKYHYIVSFTLGKKNV